MNQNFLTGIIIIENYVAINISKTANSSEILDFMPISQVPVSPG